MKASRTIEKLCETKESQVKQIRKCVKTTKQIIRIDNSVKQKQKQHKPEKSYVTNKKSNKIMQKTA